MDLNLSQLANIFATRVADGMDGALDGKHTEANFTTVINNLDRWNNPNGRGDAKISTKAFKSYISDHKADFEPGVSADLRVQIGGYMSLLNTAPETLLSEKSVRQGVLDFGPVRAHDDTRPTHPISPVKNGKPSRPQH